MVVCKYCKAPIFSNICDHCGYAQEMPKENEEKEVMELVNNLLMSVAEARTELKIVPLTKEDKKNIYEKIEEGEPEEPIIRQFYNPKVVDDVKKDILKNVIYRSSDLLAVGTEMMPSRPCSEALDDYGYVMQVAESELFDPNKEYIKSFRLPITQIEDVREMGMGWRYIITLTDGRELSILVSDDYILRGIDSKEQIKHQMARYVDCFQNGWHPFNEKKWMTGWHDEWEE